MAARLVKEIAKAKGVSINLAASPAKIRNKALVNMADAVKKSRKKILGENSKDLKNAEKLLKLKKITKVMYDRLILNEKKINSIINYILDVKKQKDPINECISAIEIDKNFNLYQMKCPIGLIAVIFESRPDVLAQVMSLSLKSGNGIIMKGGKEALNTNRIMFNILSNAAYKAGIPKGSCVLIETHKDVDEILQLDSYIDLIIPRGSNKFVKHIMQNTKIPVLGHSDGICHIYIDKKADIKKSGNIVLDAKIQYPAVCNAVETLLVHKAIAGKVLPSIKKILEDNDVKLLGCAKTRKIIDVKAASEKDWKTEYGDLKLSIKIVNDEDNAIKHINKYGSGHTDSIITEDKRAAEKFMNFVDSSCVFHNCSTRFSDGYVFGKGAEVGISTNKVHARGPAGLESLMIYKYRLYGEGQIIDPYYKGRKFTHRKLK